MIAKYLNNALETGDGVSHYESDRRYGTGPGYVKIFAEGRLKPRRPLQIIRRTDGSLVRYGDKSSARARHTIGDEAHRPAGHLGLKALARKAVRTPAAVENES
jgi:hypothetical protein